MLLKPVTCGAGHASKSARQSRQHRATVNAAVASLLDVYAFGQRFSWHAFVKDLVTR